MVSFATFLASDDSVGTGGLAGVMGSKNLRAIAVRGDKKSRVAHPESFPSSEAGYASWAQAMLRRCLPWGC